MSRIIKFKAKRNDTKEWVEGSLIMYQNGLSVIVDIRYERAYPVNPDTICQFIGLTDKNGKEVYEGDVVQWQSVFSHTSIPTPFKKGIVRYDIQRCQFIIKYEHENPKRYKDLAATSGSEEEYRMDAIEIIGNIHDK